MHSLVYFVYACSLFVGGFLQKLLFHLSICLMRCLLWVGWGFVHVGGYVFHLVLDVFASSSHFL